MQFIKKAPGRAILFAVMLFIIPNSYAQVISIEEFLRLNVKSGDLAKSTELNLDSEIVGWSNEGPQKDEIATFRNANTVDIFSANKLVSSLSTVDFPIGIKGFVAIDSTYKFYAYKQSGNENYEFGLFNLDGTLFKSISEAGLKFSPHAKFLYKPCSMENLSPISVFNLDGDEVFTISPESECQVVAPTDSQLIVSQKKLLSMWSIDSKEMIWETEIPRSNYYTDAAFEILYSVKNNIIVARDSFGCYCFDFNGSFLWSQEGINENREINMVGISKDEGNILIAAQSSNSIEAILFDQNGTNLKEFEIPIHITAYLTFNADVYKDLFLLRFWGKGDSIQKRKLVTIIAININNEWICMPVKGAWYLLTSVIPPKRVLIGFGDNKKQISTYELNKEVQND